MKLLRIVILFPLILFGIAIPNSAAYAGGWAATLLDPVPSRFDRGMTYTLGFWVLQHGTHPPPEDFGEVGLRVADAAGKELTFSGVPLREPGHYAAAIAIPAEGQWQVRAMQGAFGEQELGTLSVPGGFKTKPPEQTIGPPHAHGDGEDSPWGAVHPPGPVTDAVGTERHQADPVAQPAAQASGEAPSWRLPATLTLGSLVLLGGAAVGLRRLRRG